MDMCERIKILGEGSIGKVYLVKKDNKSYALKVEYILPYYLKKGGEVYNELKFTKEVASLYPDKFIRLLDYKISHNCSEELKPIPEFLDQSLQKKLRKAREGQICIYKLYSLIDTDLANISSKIGSWSMKHRYSMIIQILDIINIMESKNWVHGDFHPGNIGVKYTDSNYKISILGRKFTLKTYGTLLQTIDYGDLVNSNMNKNSKDIEKFNEQKWASRQTIIMLMYSEKNYWDFVRANNIQLNYKDDMFKIKQLSEFKKLRNQNRFKNLPDDLIFRLVHILYPEKFQQTLLGVKFKKVLKMKLFFPVKDILYIYSNFYETPKLINYFINKIEELN